MRLFFTIGVSILAVVSGQPYPVGSEAEKDAKKDAKEKAAVATRGAKREKAKADATAAANAAKELLEFHQSASNSPTSTPSAVPSSAPSSAPTAEPTSAPTLGCFPHISTLAKDEDGNTYWYDNKGCRPLLNEVYCPTKDHLTNDNVFCPGACVEYQADGGHCVEVNISDFHETDTDETGGFHAYPNCSSLDEDTTWGDYDETGALMTGLKNETWFNKTEHTDFVPGWYWCQKQETCLHPQSLHEKGKFDKWVGTCDSNESGNWKDHIFEAADKTIFSTPACSDPDDSLEPQIFPQNYQEHCKIHSLPAGNSYSQEKTTQCASGKVDRCEGAVAFFFSIAGFGHNYNFNFCLSKLDSTTGKRSNDWDNGIDA